MSSQYHYLVISAGCGEPTPPSRGSIDNFQSAAEGATMTYSCSPGLVPGTQMSAVCTNMTWRPDPVTLQCRKLGVCTQSDMINVWCLTNQCWTSSGSSKYSTRQIMSRTDALWQSFNPTADCGAPSPPVNGFLNLTNTTEGSAVVFQCDPGFVPEGKMTAVCGRDGQWTPNPGGTTCSPRPKPTSTQATTPTETSTATSRNYTHCTSSRTVLYVCVG